jgi:hypothetical protein
MNAKTRQAMPNMVADWLFCGPGDESKVNIQKAVCCKSIPRAVMVESFTHSMSVPGSCLPQYNQSKEY